LRGREHSGEFLAEHSAEYWQQNGAPAAKPPNWANTMRHSSASAPRTLTVVRLLLRVARRIGSS
jgi:hypothetical protein